MYPDVVFLGLTLYEWCLLLGIIVALIVARVYADRLNVPAKLQNFTFIVAIFAIVLGLGSAVLFQATYDFFETGVFEIGKNTGATFYGGFLGGAAVFLIGYFLIGKKLFGDLPMRYCKQVTGFAACGVARHRADRVLPRGLLLRRKNERMVRNLSARGRRKSRSHPAVRSDLSLSALRGPLRPAFKNPRRLSRRLSLRLRALPLSDRISARRRPRLPRRKRAFPLAVLGDRALSGGHRVDRNSAFPRDTQTKTKISAQKSPARYRSPIGNYGKTRAG